MSDSDRQPDDVAKPGLSSHEAARQKALDLRAQQDLMQSEQRLLDMQRRELRKQIGQKRFKVLIYGAVLWIRHVSDSINPWRPGTWALTAMVIGATCILLIPTTGAFIFGTILGAVIFAPLFLFPIDEVVERKRFALIDEVARDTTEYAKFSGEYVQHSSETDRVGKHYEQTAEDLRRKEVFESRGGRRNSLFQRNWRALRGEQFSKFMKTVFEELGFEIELPKKGTEGVDFIAARTDRRICLQLQTEDGGASERAVQNVHYAMGANRCDRCAVITNRHATQAARELGHAIGCIVIDQDSMQALILGKVVQ